MPGPVSRKIRIDRLLTERGVAASREKAQALILAGRVMAGNQKVEKCGTAVDATIELRVLDGKEKYVSRAGWKLEGALARFQIDPAGRVCMDVGASTGGFTQCLLSHNAAKVYAVDAGTNQLDWKIRNDPRVVVMEKTNARYLQPGQFRERVDLVTVDVSFISATLLIPVLPPLIASKADVLILVKPQFEAGRAKVGKGGIIRDPALHREAVEKVAGCLNEFGFQIFGSAESQLPGATGNREFFVYAVRKE
ncbi:MAG: TlyA family RNA methyltransferase [Acidobacteriota bacterium]|nr:TlyA family RNA methyltransferase [Acidobacteriota bacterium]